MFMFTSIMMYVIGIVSNTKLYMVLTVCSEICGVLRVYPTFYVCKVCIDMVRELQKIVLLTGTYVPQQKEECMHYTPCTDEPDAPIAPAPWEPPLYTVGRIEVSSEQYSEMVDAHIACAKKYVQKRITVQIPTIRASTPTRTRRKKTVYIGMAITAEGQEKPFYVKM